MSQLNAKKAPQPAPVKLGYDPSVGKSTRADTDLADTTIYNRPDPRQQRLVGAGATVIPRAVGNVSSGCAGFSTEINIDPTDPATGAGGRKVNLGDLDKNVMNKALVNADSAEGAWDIVRDLQAAPARPQRQAATQPQAAPQVAQPSVDLLAQLGALQLPSAPAALPASPPPPPPPQPTQAALAPQPDYGHQIQVLTQVMQQMLQRQVTAIPAPMPPTTPDMQRHPLDVPEQRTVIAEVPPTALESLELGFLSEKEEGAKPTVPVVFEMGPGGQVSIKYHEVVVYGGLLVLVFDTRWDGMQFFPPAVDYTIGVSLPAKNKNFRVYSRNCVFPLGKIEVCVLIVAKDEDAVERDELEEEGQATLAPPLPKRRMPMPPPRTPIIDIGDPPPEDEAFPPML